MFLCVTYFVLDSGLAYFAISKHVLYLHYALHDSLVVYHLRMQLNTTINMFAMT